MADGDGGGFTLEAFKEKVTEIKRESCKLVSLSVVERLALCEKDEGGALDRAIGDLSHLDRLRFFYDWKVWGRPKQWAPAGAWDLWLCLGGRGVGKTRTGAEWFVGRLLHRRAVETVLIGPTFGEIRRTMVGGYERRCDGLNV